MGVDKGRADQPAMGVDHRSGLGLQVGLNCSNPVALKPDIDVAPAIGQVGTANDHIEHKFLPCNELSFSLAGW